MRVREELKTFGAKKKMGSVKSLSSGVMKELYKRVVVRTVTYGKAGMRKWKKCGLDFMEVKCPRSVCGVARRDRERLDEMRRKFSMEEKIDVEWVETF